MRYDGEALQAYAYAGAMKTPTGDEETIERLSLKTARGAWEAIMRIQVYTREGGRRDQLRRLLAVSLAEHERGYIERIKELEVHRQYLLGRLGEHWHRDGGGGILADAGGELQQLLLYKDVRHSPQQNSTRLHDMLASEESREDFFRIMSLGNNWQAALLDVLILGATKHEQLTKLRTGLLQTRPFQEMMTGLASRELPYEDATALREALLILQALKPEESDSMDKVVEEQLEVIRDKCSEITRVPEKCAAYMRSPYYLDMLECLAHLGERRDERRFSEEANEWIEQLTSGIHVLFVQELEADAQANPQGDPLDRVLEGLPADEKGRPTDEKGRQIGGARHKENHIEAVYRLLIKPLDKEKRCDFTEIDVLIHMASLIYFSVENVKSNDSPEKEMEQQVSRPKIVDAVARLVLAWGESKGQMTLPDATKGLASDLLWLTPRAHALKGREGVKELIARHLPSFLWTVNEKREREAAAAGRLTDGSGEDNKRHKPR